MPRARESTRPMRWAEWPQLQPQLRTSLRFYFHQATRRRSGSLRQQFHKGGRCAHCSASSTLAYLPPRPWLRSRLESIHPLLQTRPVHTQRQRRSFNPIPSPTSPRRPTTPPAAVTAPGVYCETPQTASATAPHLDDSLPIPASRRQASRPRHNLSAKLNRSHARLPETHEVLPKQRDRGKAKKVPGVVLEFHAHSFGCD